MTDGIQVVEGILVFDPPAAAIPQVFWDRLRRAVADAGFTDALRDDYGERREHVRQQRRESLWWGAPENMAAEREFFRRWVERLGLAVERWPWERGWTEDHVDAYLVAPARAATEAA